MLYAQSVIHLSFLINITIFFVSFYKRKVDAIMNQHDRNKDVGGVSRLRGAFEVGGGGDMLKTGVVKSDGVDEVNRLIGCLRKR